MMFFAVIDFARDPTGEIETAVARHASDAVCLYREPFSDQVRRCAPHLLPLPQGSGFARYWAENGWGRGWGIIVQCNQTLSDLRRHLRKFLRVQLPDGDFALFRFYDPLVLPAYLRSCNRDELAMWFAGVSAYRVESTSGAHTDFSFDGVVLRETAGSAPFAALHRH